MYGTRARACRAASTTSHRCTTERLGNWWFAGLVVHHFLSLHDTWCVAFHMGIHMVTWLQKDCVSCDAPASGQRVPRYGGGDVEFLEHIHRRFVVGHRVGLGGGRHNAAPNRARVPTPCVPHTVGGLCSPVQRPPAHNNDARTNRSPFQNTSTFSVGPKMSSDARRRHALARANRTEVATRCRVRLYADHHVHYVCLF